MSEELIGAAALTSQYVVALVFLAAAIPKLTDRREFERAVRNYQLLPDRAVRPVASWLPRLELACSLALISGVAVSLFAGVAAVTLATFAGAIALNLIRGRSIDCGCRGSITPRRIGWGFVVGDLLLAGLAVMAALEDPRTLSMVSGSDAVIGASDGIALFLLAVALVVAWLILTSARELWLATRRLELRPGMRL